MKHFIIALVAVASLGAAGPAAARSPIFFPEVSPSIIFEKIRDFFVGSTAD